jgi:hypothetical protein
MRCVRYADLAVRFTFSNVVMPENEEENLSRNVEENIRGIQSLNISDPANQNGQELPNVDPKDNFLRTYPSPMSHNNFPNYFKESRRIRELSDEFIHLDKELYVFLITIPPNVPN